jgi:hypothetical protein
MFAMSRPLMFTSITARPDLLCCVCGWGAIACMWRWADRQLRSDCLGAPELIGAGVLCGFGLLFHPFALVACLQCGVWSLLRRGTMLARWLRALVLTACSLLIVSLWLPLILRFPYEFQSQFTSNVLERSGPGVLHRLLWPWASLAHHWQLQFEYNQPFQFWFLVSGAFLGSAVLICSGPSLGIPNPSRFRLLGLTWSACYLTATIAGIHPTKGYWVYPIAFLYPVALLGYNPILQAMARWLGWGSMSLPWRVLRTALISLGSIAIMIPGTGLTTLAAYLRDGGSPRTSAPKFIEAVLSELPSEGLFLVDANYVFDVYLTGRDTILCQPRERFWGDATPAYRYMLIGREGMDIQAPQDYGARRWREFGEQETPASCYVNIFVPDSRDPDDVETTKE